EFIGTLQPGESYTSTLHATLPSLTPGSYRVIVRADVFNQVYEGVNDSNNAATSADAVDVVAAPLYLGVPLATTPGSGQERLYQLTVPLGRTRRVTVTAADDSAAEEVFLRHGAAPTSTVFDAGSKGELASRQLAVVPATEPGVYYVLVRGFSMPSPATP